MAIKHYVKHSYTGERSEIPDAAEVARRNREYEMRKHNAITESYFDATRESRYESKQKEDFHRRAKLVPYTIRNITEEAYKKFPEIVFRDYFTSLVTEALSPTEDEFGRPKSIWDKELVESCTEGIRYMCHAYINSLGGMKYLKEVAESTNSDYLRKVYKVCLETGNKLAANKKVKLEKTVNPNNVEDQAFDLNIDTEDEEMLNKNISDLDIKDISDLVKDKVLEVVKDEEVKHEEDQQFQATLKEEIKAAKQPTEEIPEGEEMPRTINNGDADSSSSSGGTSAPTSSVTTTSGAAKDSSNGGDSDETDTDEEKNEDSDKTAKESFNRNFTIQNWAMNSRLDLQTSLLKSLTMKCYSKAIKEGVGIGAIAAKNNRMSINQMPPAAMNIYDTFMHGENDDLYYIDFAKNSQRPAIASSITTGIDSEEVLEQSFAEALGFFTVLECAYTIKLINPTRRDVEKTIMYYSKNN